MMDEERTPAGENTPAETPAPTGEDRFAAFDEPIRRDTDKPKKRKPYLLTILIAAGAILLLLGTLLLLKITKPEEAESSTPEVSSDSCPVLDKGNTSLLSAEIGVADKKAYTVALDTKSNEYHLTGYEDITLDSDDVRTLVECSLSFNALSQLDYDPDDDEAYGFNSPKSTVRLTYLDGTEETVVIGAVIPTGDGYYVRVGDAAYICSEEMVSPYLLTYLEYVNTLLIAPPQVDSNDEDGQAMMKSMELTGKAHPQKLSIRRITKDDELEYSYFAYIIEKPYFRGVSTDVDAILNSFTSLYSSGAVALHPSAEVLKGFGFDDPYAVAKVTLAVESSHAPSAESSDGFSFPESSTDDEEEMPIVYYNTQNVTITVGSVTKDNDYLVMVSGTDAVFYVARSSLSGIVERQYEDTVSELLFLKDITTLSRVDFTVNGKASKVTLAHHPEEEDNDKAMTVKLNGTVTGTDNFRALYRQMMGLRRYAGTAGTPEGEPTVSIALYLNDGRLFISFDFYPTSGSLYTVRSNEGELFVVRAGDIDEFVKQVERFVSGNEVIER